MISKASLRIEYRLLFIGLTVSQSSPFLLPASASRLIQHDQQVSLALLSFGNHFTFRYSFDTDIQA